MYIIIIYYISLYYRETFYTRDIIGIFTSQEQQRIDKQYFLNSELENPAIHYTSYQVYIFAILECENKKPCDKIYNLYSAFVRPKG